MEKDNVNLMNLAPRCRAKSKRTGERCKAPAVKGRPVCRIHGAAGGAPEGKRNGNYRHGGRTTEAMEALALVRAMTRLCQRALNQFDER